MRKQSLSKVKLSKPKKKKHLVLITEILHKQQKNNYFICNEKYILNFDIGLFTNDETYINL